MIPLRANHVSDLFGEDWVWLLLRLAILAVVAFAAAWLATFLAMGIALVPYFRSRVTEWSELARLSWGGRRLGLFCMFLVPAPIVVGALAGLADLGPWTKYSAAMILTVAAWVGVLWAPIPFARRISPAFAMTPRPARNHLSSSLLIIVGILGISAAAFGLGASKVMPWAIASGLGIVLLTAFFWWGWLAGLWVLGVAYPGNDRLKRVTAGVAESMGAHPAGVFELALPMANAMAFPHLGRLACTPAFLGILNDDQLAAVMAHEFAHLTEPRKVFWMRLARPFALACFIFGPVLLLSTDVGPGWGWLVELVAFLLLIIFLKRWAAMSRKMEVRADEIAKSFEREPGVYAQALEKLYQANLVPVVLVAKNLTHPNLYDRLVAVGAQPDYPRPEPPPRRLGRLGMLIALGLAITAGYAIASIGRALEPDDSEPDDSVVGIILQEPRQLLEVRARLNEANDRDQGLGIDELLERDVVQVELARDRDQHAVQPVFDKRPIRAHAQLASQDDVKRMRRGTASLIAELDPVHAPFATGLSLVLGLDQLSQRGPELGVGQ